MPRVVEIRLFAGWCIDRIELVYADGRSWFCGGLGGGRRPGLTLDEDEYVEQVEHELLEQRLYAGAGVCLRTNKGRSLAC